MLNNLNQIARKNSLSAIKRLFSSVNYLVKDSVAVIKLDTPNSSVNTLSKSFSDELLSAFNRFQADKSAVAAVLISGKPNCFVAGADIKMLKQCKTKEELVKLSNDAKDQFNLIENSQKPVISAIKGSCLGGGLELVLATHYRIAVKDSKTVFGFPEVKLGLLPGAGGSQRIFEKCISLNEAMQMMLTGSNKRADKAKKLGIVDQVISPLGPGINDEATNTYNYLESVAIDTAKKIAQGTLKASKPNASLQDKIINKLLNNEMTRNLFMGMVEKKVKSMTKGLYPAPEKIIDLTKQSIAKGKELGYKLESEYFGELGMTNVSRALFGLFEGTTECKKDRCGKPTSQVKTVSVLGSGLMGAGIAQVSIQNKMHCIMKDVNQTGLDRGIHQIQKNFEGQIKKKRMTRLESDKIISNLQPTLEMNDLKNSDLIIEAVFEDINLKHKILQEVEKVMRPDAIFASNTSALPIKEIASVSKNPENIIGMHYFSPVDKMQLLEIITTDQTSKEALKVATNVGLRQGKLIIVVKDGPGFYTTRLLAPMLLEAVLLFQEGVTPSRMDKVTKNFGWPVGMATLSDEVGLDVALHVATDLEKRLGDRIKSGNVNLLKELVDNNYLGRKTGKGLFVYGTSKKSERFENPDLSKIIDKYKIESASDISDEDIQYRLFSRFVNEAVLCLEEGILTNGPLEGDIGAVFGLGFPPNFGGPFRYLDLYGAGNLVKKMEEFQKIHPNQFKPCNLLMEHAKDDSKRFHKN